MQVSCLNIDPVLLMKDHGQSQRSLVNLFVTIFSSPDPARSFVVRTVINPAYKWVGIIIHACTDQCLIVKHEQVSPAALKWKAITVRATIYLS